METLHIYGKILVDFPKKNKLHCLGWCHNMTPSRVDANHFFIETPQSLSSNLTTGSWNFHLAGYHEMNPSH